MLKWFNMRFWKRRLYMDLSFQLVVTVLSVSVRAKWITKSNIYNWDRFFGVTDIVLTVIPHDFFPVDPLDRFDKIFFIFPTRNQSSVIFMERGSFIFIWRLDHVFLVHMLKIYYVDFYEFTIIYVSIKKNILVFSM